MLRRLLFAGVGAALLSLPVVAGPVGEPDRATVRTPGIAPRAIFGGDDRYDLYAVSDPGLREAADAVAVLVDNRDLDCAASGTSCDLSTKPLLDGRACADEPFATQPTAGFCTGFLVAADMVATAGHCISDLTCAFTAFVFDFGITEPEGVANVSNLQTYRCAEVVESVLRYDFGDDGLLQGGADYALVRLDRPVTDRAPLVVRRERTVEVGDQIAGIGYPEGLPLKVVGGAEVRSVADAFFRANLDLFGGSSGSPVLDLDTLGVVGILVRGPEDDWFYDDEAECIRSVRYRDTAVGLGLFAQATHAALLPVAGTCVDSASCPATATMATCKYGLVSPDPNARYTVTLHYPDCAECSGERARTRTVRRKIKKALRLVRGPRRTRQVKKALRNLERAASRLEQAHAGGRVSVRCRGALRSVIDEALDIVRFVLE